jgi:hypothetical protein
MKGRDLVDGRVKKSRQGSDDVLLSRCERKSVSQTRRICETDDEVWFSIFLTRKVDIPVKRWTDRRLSVR